ncbi:hypothetical protein N2152v2_000620 [Parachlorella kessleri]
MHTAARLEHLSLVVTCPSATQLLAGYFASDLHPADTYLLYGSVGAGKSYFCREFIRVASEDESLPVPSPTFLLQNIYELPTGPPIHHFDLYRLTAPHDLLRLDLPSSLTKAVSLIEWAERLERHLPEEHLAVHLQVIPEEEQAALQQHQGLTALPSMGLESLDAEESGDLRWRRIVLRGGGQRWQQRLKSLRLVLDVSGPKYGCWLLPSAVTTVGDA